MRVERLLSYKAAAVGALLLLLAGGAAVLAGMFRSGRPELRVGFNRYIPFVMPGEDGQPTGLAYEIVSEAARRANIRLKWVRCGESVDSELRKGTIDLFPLLTVTAPRIAEFHVSEPWWDNETALISRQSAPVQVKSAAGKRIAIRGLPILKALALSLFPRSELVTTPAIPDMVNALCSGRVDAAFLDLRLLQTELLKGPAACVGRALHITSVPGGSLSQGTVSRKEVAAAADRIYEEIAELAVNGTLSETASRWSLVNSFHNRHMKDILDARQRARIMRYGLLALSIALIVSWAQSELIRRARRAAEESRQRFDAFMKHTPALTFIRDEAGRIVYANGAGSSNLNLPAEQIADRLRVSHPEADIDGSIESMETLTLDSGEQRHFLCLRFPFANSQGRKFLGAIALDVTERRKAEQELRFSQFSIEKSPDSILWADSKEQVFYANEAACTALGYCREELTRLQLSDIYFQWNRNQPGGTLLSCGESAYRRKDGSFVPAEVALYRLEFDGADFTCCISRDITERKRAERELAFQARHDSLTGLPNRRCFEARLGDCISAAQQTGTGLSVFYLDLDRFKLINDTLGHTLGDSILKQVVRRIANCLRPGETLARVGGDEFTLIAPGVDNRAAARALGDRVLSCLQESFAVGNHELMVTASIGISMFPEDASEATTLLQNADAAMYEAKRQGKNRQQFFDPALNITIRERLDIENNLRRALERNELSVHYQPEISLQTGEILRYEALLRWNSAVLGSISPAKFIPVAEETGLIVPIGEWVLTQACGYARKLFDAGVNAGIGVNVSSVQFSRPDFLTTVRNAIDRAGLPGCLLELEITESVVMQGLEEVASKLDELRQLGVSISIDDFGTGYSSLSYLRTLRVDGLKIDRSFVKDIPFDSHALSLTQALVSLAHALDMKVVVEGIETRQQLDAVRSLGCDMAQGYFTGRPMPAIPLAGRSVSPDPSPAETWQES